MLKRKPLKSLLRWWVRRYKVGSEPKKKRIWGGNVCNIYGKLDTAASSLLGSSPRVFDGVWTPWRTTYDNLLITSARYATSGSWTLIYVQQNTRNGHLNQCFDPNCQGTLTGSWRNARQIKHIKHIRNPQAPGVSDRASGMLGYFLRVHNRYASIESRTYANKVWL